MPSRSLILTMCAAAALSACDQPRTPARPEPLFTPASGGGETYLPPLAPAWQDLPSAPAAPLRRTSYASDYGYAERAYALDRAFYEAPPDYGFYSDEVEPWAWRSYDGYTVFAEPVESGYRYYYYEPGMDWPFFVRTPDYGYGYGTGGVLLVIYSAAGVLLPYDRYDDYAPRAGRYWARGETLYSAARARQAPVAYENWLARRPVLTRSQAPWMSAADRRPEWRGYRDRDDSRELRHFARERDRRQQAIDHAQRQEVRQALGRGEDPRRMAALDRREARIARQDDRRQDRREERSRPDRDEARRAAPARAPEPARMDRAQAREDRRNDRDARRIEAARVEQRARRDDAPRMERRAAQAEQQAQRRREVAEARSERAERRAEPAVRDRQPPVQRIERPVQPQRQERPQERRAEAPRQERRVEAPRPEPRPQRAEAPRPERPQRAEAPRQERAQDAGRSGRDAAGREHGGGRPDKPRKD
jgi:hypothetical protein